MASLAGMGMAIAPLSLPIVSGGNGLDSVQAQTVPATVQRGYSLLEQGDVNGAIAVLSKRSNPSPIR